MNDREVWLAVAGISGTLLAGILVPVLAGRTQRAALKSDRILDRRLAAYAELLETCIQLRDNAQT